MCPPGARRFVQCQLDLEDVVVGVCWRWAPAIPMPQSGASSRRCGQRDIPVSTWSPDQESMWSAQRSACSVALLPDPSTW